jgi:hypothetical protein
MALGLNKIVLASANTNTPGAYWQLTTLTGNNSTTVVPAGTYLLFPTANVTIEAVSAYNTNTACATPSTWSTLIGNNTGGVLISDGVNVRANVTVATATTITLATVNGGQAASGTYNT